MCSPPAAALTEGVGWPPRKPLRAGAAWMDDGYRKGSTHPTKRPPTSTIILAIRISCELWCRPRRHEPKVLGGSRRFALAAAERFRAQNSVTLVGGTFEKTRRGIEYENGILARWRAGTDITRFCRGFHQDRLCLDLQRPDRRDRQRHAQLVRARARSSRPQEGGKAGRSDLRGRSAEA